MTEDNIKKFVKLCDKSDGTTSWLEILQDNFSFREVFGRDPVLITEGIGIQKMDGPTGQIFKLRLYDKSYS